MNRREFLQAGVAVGAGLVLAPGLSGADKGADAINVALVGVGEHGRALMHAALAVPGVRIRAICDIWDYRRKPAVNYLKTCGQEARDYVDYREMLSAEKDLHAAIIATPDFVHGEQANACMKAGLHVYCEKPLASTLEGARSMVRTMRGTGRLMQVGYQRRSNPRYQHVQQRLIGEAKLPGRITHVNGQWSLPVREDLGWPRRFAMTDEALQRFGYGSMQEMRNWRNYRRYCAGPFADFGGQQVDIANWMVGATPRAVMASGGKDYYKDREWPDNVMAIVEYATAEGVVRAFFEVLSTTSAGGGNHEHVMGTEGSIRISENPKWTKIFREAYAPDWDRWTRLHYLAREDGAVASAEATTQPADPNEVRSRETGKLVQYDLPVVMDRPPHQAHLENFFEAMRGKAKLSCPADVAFASEAAVWKVNQAIESKSMVSFAPEDFVA